MKAAIAIEPWKLPVFERVLGDAGFTIESKSEVAGVLLLTVHTESALALSSAVTSAQNEARLSRMQ